MSKVIDYYIFLSSPWVYLGSRRFTEIAQKHRAEVRVRPMAAQIVFPSSGGLPLAKRHPARQAYRLVELARWRDYLDMPLNVSPKFFPIPDAQAAYFVIAADRTGGDPLALANAIGRAAWAEERNIDDLGTLQEIARETGHHDTNLTAAALDPDVRTIHEAYSQEALDTGVFGAPSYVYNGEIFWGQDRLEFLERALAAD